MKGIEEGYELPREAEDDVWSLTERERTGARHRAAAEEPVRRDRGRWRDSELVAETLGEHVFDFFLRNKRAEWEEYREQVTAFERDRMLPGHLSDGHVSPRVLVVEHEADCPPAARRSVAGGRRLPSSTSCRPYAGDALPALGGYDGLVVLGGSMGADDDADAPG